MSVAVVKSADDHSVLVAGLQASIEQDVPIPAITSMPMLSQVAEQEAARRQEDDITMS